MALKIADATFVGKEIGSLLREAPMAFGQVRSCGVIRACGRTVGRWRGWGVVVCGGWAGVLGFVWILNGVEVGGGGGQIGCSSRLRIGGE